MNLGTGSVLLNIPEEKQNTAGWEPSKNEENDGGYPSLPEYNTLDEPVLDTVMRDVRAIWVKLTYVLYPKGERSITLIKDWDLWGPFIICFFLSVFLQGSSSKQSEHGGDPEFAEMFAILWFGAALVALNSKLLGGHMSFFQSVCILGYCLLPSLLSLNVCSVILLFEQTRFMFFLRFLVTFAGFVWATYASLVFLGNSQQEGKKGLALYPIFLFYFFIAWVILSHTS